MNAPSTAASEPQAPPRLIAVSGVIFAVLYIASLVLIRLSVPADPMESGAWLADPTYRRCFAIALNLIPFAGIAFLWFMAVLRHRIGLREDRFFATVFLGSGLLFVAMLFVAAAVSQSLYALVITAPPRIPSENYRMARGLVNALLNTYGMKMAAVFMFMTSTIGLRTAVLARGVSLTGYALGLILLLVITDFVWIALLFPCWVLLVSVWILVAESRH